MRASHWVSLTAIVILVVLAFIVGRSLYYGPETGNYTPPERELAGVNLDVAAVSDRMEAVDNPTVSQGEVIVDFAHNNALFVEELNVLFSKIVAPPQSDDEEGGKPLVDRLQYAEALILPLAREPYTDEEIKEIERFVEKGGRVFIIGDPTRTVDVDALNSVAGAFGIIYPNDYIYSLNDDSMDNNYRNVIYSDFIDSPVTAGLSAGDKVIFYSAGSVNAPGSEIIFGDEHTFSSVAESEKAMAAAALTAKGQVLALGDLTFFSEPYSAAESNGILINNIADFITANNRSYELKDFPYFFNDNVDVVFDDTLVFNSQFEDAAKLKEMLEENGQTVTFANEIGSANDVIYVGRFADTEMVQEFLDTKGITIIDQEKPEEGFDEILVSDDTAAEAAEAAEAEKDKETPSVADEAVDTDVDQDFVEGRIQIAGAGELERGGATLFSLIQKNGRNILVILSDNPDTNADAFELLMGNELVGCLVDPMTAVCQTEEPGQKLPPSLRKTRVNKILVVADDDGRVREDDQTSVAEYEAALGETYKVTTWETSGAGSPSLEELQEYDAIIWSTGNYWDDSIDGDDAKTLGKYIDAGGNLLLSGASIAFDWDHTDFLNDIVHADYLTFAEQADVEVINDEHPIARDFAMGDVISLTIPSTEEPLQPDVVNHTIDSRVIFQRGPDSEKSGAAAVIAYEDDRAKVAYYAFPLYLLPAEAQATLVNNTVDWFTRKPLDLPTKKEYKPFESTADGEEDESVDGTEDTTGENGEESPAQDGKNGDNGENGDGNGNGEDKDSGGS